MKRLLCVVKRLLKSSVRSRQNALLLLLPTRLSKRHKHELYVKKKLVIIGTQQVAVEVVGRMNGIVVVAAANVVTVVAVASAEDRRRLEIKKWQNCVLNGSKAQ